MKEMVVRVEESIAKSLLEDASERGLSIAELVRGILGEYVITHVKLADKISTMLEASLNGMDKMFEGLDKKIMKMKASQGALSCKNCTMRLTEKDVDEGKCGSCGAPINGTSDKSNESQ